MQNVDIMSRSKAASDYINLAEKTSELPKDKLTAKQEYWQGQARKLAISEKMDIAVVHGGWVGPKSVADKWGHEIVYVAQYVGGGSE